MKTVTIEVKGSSPDEIIGYLNEIKQALALDSEYDRLISNEGYVSNLGKYKFAVSGEYDQ